MKKFLTVSLMMLLIMSLNAFATETRVMTMGDNNTILLDEANIWQFPSRINDYPNLAIAEYSYFGSDRDDFTDFGIHWKFGNDNPWILGTYFSVLPAYVPSNLFGDDLIPFDFSLMNNRRIDLLYGRQLGANNFGFGLSYYHSSMTYDGTGNQTKEAFGYYDFSAGLTEATGQWDVALDFGMGGWTDEGVNGDAETEADGFMDFALMGRYFWQQNPNITLVPHVGIGYSKRGLKNNVMDGILGDPSDLDYSYIDKATFIDLGCGMNYTPATNVLAVFDFGFTYAKGKHEDDTTATFINDGTIDIVGEETLTNWYFPYFKIGMDADVFKWMDIRFGATSYWTSLSDEDQNGNKFNRRYPENDTYLGFGFHWNRLHVDTYTDPDLFLKGFNFITGTTTNMNFQISAVYEMM